jgi:hypothetical protein
MAGSGVIMPQVGDHDQASYTERFRSLARLVFEPSGLEVLAEQTTGEELPGESMQSAVWQAGCVLANVMQQPEHFAPGFWHGKRVLELGAGCGVAGEPSPYCSAMTVSCQQCACTAFSQVS